MNLYNVHIKDRIAQRNLYAGDDFNADDPDLRPFKDTILEQYPNEDLSGIHAYGIPTANATYLPTTYVTYVCTEYQPLGNHANWYSGADQDLISRVKKHYQIPKPQDASGIHYQLLWEDAQSLVPIPNGWALNHVGQNFDHEGNPIDHWGISIRPIERIALSSLTLPDTPLPATTMLLDLDVVDIHYEKATLTSIRSLVVPMIRKRLVWDDTAINNQKIMFHTESMRAVTNLADTDVTKLNYLADGSINTKKGNKRAKLFRKDRQTDGTFRKVRAR